MIESNKDLKTQGDRLEFWLEAQGAVAKVKGKGLIAHADDYRLWEIYQIIYPGAEPRFKKCGDCTARRIRQVKGWIDRQAEFMETLLEEKFGEKMFAEMKVAAEKSSWFVVFAKMATNRENLKKAVEAFALEFQIDVEDVKARMKTGETLDAIREDLAAKLASTMEGKVLHLDKSEADFEIEGRTAFEGDKFLKDNPYEDQPAIAWSKGYQIAKRKVMEEGAESFNAGGPRETAYPSGPRKNAWNKGYDEAKKAAEANVGPGKEEEEKQPDAELTNEATSENAE